MDFSLQFSDNTLENNMKSAFFWSKLLEGTSSHFDTHLLAVISSALKLLSISPGFLNEEKKRLCLRSVMCPHY